MKRTFDESLEEVDAQFHESRARLADSAYCMYVVFHMTERREREHLWLTRAVSLGHGSAAFKLGKLHYQGEEVPKDLGKAKRLFYMSAEKGHAAAQCLVALYEYKTDFPRAMEWIEKARLQGYKGVQKALDMMVT